jgi:hypothetical protein
MRNPKFLFLLALILALGVTTYVSAHPGGPTEGVIHACVNQQSGQIKSLARTESAPIRNRHCTGTSRESKDHPVQKDHQGRQERLDPAAGPQLSLAETA